MTKKPADLGCDAQLGGRALPSSTHRRGDSLGQGSGCSAARSESPGACAGQLALRGGASSPGQAPGPTAASLPLLWTVSQAPHPVLQGHRHADATLMGVPTITLQRPQPSQLESRKTA